MGNVAMSCIMLRDRLAPNAWTNEVLEDEHVFLFEKYPSSQIMNGVFNHCTVYIMKRNITDRKIGSSSFIWWLLEINVYHTVHARSMVRNEMKRNCTWTKQPYMFRSQEASYAYFEFRDNWKTNDSEFFRFCCHEYEMYAKKNVV